MNCTEFSQEQLWDQATLCWTLLYLKGERKKKKRDTFFFLSEPMVFIEFNER